MLGFEFIPVLQAASSRFPSSETAIFTALCPSEASPLSFRVVVRCTAATAAFLVRVTRKDPYVSRSNLERLMTGQTRLAQSRSGALLTRGKCSISQYVFDTVRCTIVLTRAH